MKRHAFTYCLLLLLAGAAFAGTIVGVGETVPVSTSGNVVPPSEETGTDSALNDTGQEQAGEGSGGDSGQGGIGGVLTVTDSSGDSITFGSSGEAAFESVEVTPGQEVQVRESGNGSFAPYGGAQGGNGTATTEQMRVQAQLVSQTSSRQLAIELQAQQQQTLMQMDGASATTQETIRIRERAMYVERSGKEYAVNVLPVDIAGAASSEGESVEGMELRLEGEKPVYEFTLRGRRDFLWIIPVDSETTFVVDAQNAQVVSESGPWWGFIAPPRTNVYAAMERVSAMLGTASAP